MQVRIKQDIFKATIGNWTSQNQSTLLPLGLPFHVFYKVTLNEKLQKLPVKYW